MVKLISVISGNGGMGKSFLSCNLSYGLKNLGKKVLLAEAALGTRADDIILGIKSDTLYTIKDIFEGSCKVSEAVTSSENEALPDFISASHLHMSGDFTEGFKNIRNYAIERYDYVIIDIPFSRGAIADAAYKFTDILIALTDTSPISVRNTALCVKHGGDMGVSDKFLVINHTHSEEISDEAVTEDIIDEIFAPLLGIIPYDEYVYASLMEGNPIYKYNTYAGRAIENICKRILGISVPEYEQKSKSRLFAGNRLVLK